MHVTPRRCSASGLTPLGKSGPLWIDEKNISPACCVAATEQQEHYFFKIIYKKKKNGPDFHLTLFFTPIHGLLYPPFFIELRNANESKWTRLGMKERTGIDKYRIKRQALDKRPMAKSDSRGMDVGSHEW